MRLSVRYACLLERSSNVQQDFVAYGLTYTSPLAFTDGAKSSWKSGIDMYMTLDDRARLKGIVQYEPGTGEEFSVVASTGLGPDQVSLQYMHKMGAHVNLFTETNFSFAADKQTKKKDWVSVCRFQECALTFHQTFKLGYSYSTRDDASLHNLPTPSIKATVDTSANVAVFLEEPLSDFLVANFTLKVRVLSQN